MIWQPKYETMDREALAQLQLERLQATLTRVSRNVPFYRRKFEELAVDPDDFRSLDDLRRLPFTTKADLRDNYPYGMFAVPLREVVRLQASSGTTGKPVVAGYTKNDVARWTELTARVLAAAGVTKDDVVQITLAYGLFTGGFGFHYGAEHIGASVIPSSSGNTRRQIAIIQDYKTTTLVGTPSYALYLADAMDEMGVNANALGLKYALCGAEVWSESMRRQIQDRLKVAATDNYGLSEVMGPGIAGECLERQGLHLNEDHFLVEVVDPGTCEPVAPGEVGELTLTTLTKEAFPLIRYRTGDLTRLLPGACACGRTFARMDRVLGRADDMFTVKGVNVFPSQVEAILLAIPGLSAHYEIVLTREGALDHAAVNVEAAPDLLEADSMREAQKVQETARKRLHSELGVNFEVKLLVGKSLPRPEGKAKRVRDERKY